MNNIILIGMPGCGKTTIGRQLATILGRIFFDADQVLEEVSGQTIKELFVQGEDVFRAAESDTIAYLASKVGAVIATGGGVVKKEDNMKTLHLSGIIIFLNRSPGEIMQDVDVTNRPLLVEDKARLYNIYEERITLYHKYADYEVNCNKDMQEILAEILTIVKGVRI